jgi:hypothetical protein
MPSTEKPHEPESHRKVISREPPWWIVTFYAPGLPAEGVSVRRRTFAEANEAWWNLYPSEFRGKGVIIPDYDFGPDTDAKYVAYLKAHRAKLGTSLTYASAGAELTSALAGEHQASLRDIASLLHHSYWRVSRLQADRPMHVGETLHSCLRLIPSRRAQRWVARSAHVADIAARQARIIAVDSVREARAYCQRTTTVGPSGRRAADGEPAG